MKYKLSHFIYYLPENRKAQMPSRNRDESKLMVLHKNTGEIEHRRFKNIIDYFDPGDIMVLNNNTKKNKRI